MLENRKRCHGSHQDWKSGKTWKKREGIFQSGKSRGILSRLEKSGNFAQNTGKTGKFELKKCFL